MNSNRLETENITSLLLRFSIPSMIAIFVSTIYNIVDRIFIGQFVGPDALAGLTIVFPIMLVIFGGSALIGRGGANLLSISLGKGDIQESQKVFTVTVVTALIFGITMSLVGFVTLNPFLRFLGATESVLRYGSDYMSIILVGVIFWIMSFTLSSTVRAEGKATLSMVAMIASAIANIVLDYFLIVTLNMGVQGAAIATIIAQALGLVVLLRYYFMQSKDIVINKKYLKPELSIVKRLLTIGIPSYFVTVGNGISMMVLNKYLGLYGGVGAVASIGAIGSLMTFFNIPVLGIQNGIQPIIGFNYGAQNQSRINETIQKSIIMTVFTGCILFILIRMNSIRLVKLFLGSHSNYVQMGSRGLRIYSLLIPFTAIINISIAYFQSIEKALKATFIASCKQLALLIPIVILFSRIWGITGIWYSVPIADGLTIVLALALIYHENRTQVIKKTSLTMMKNV